MTIEVKCPTCGQEMIVVIPQERICDDTLICDIDDLSPRCRKALVYNKITTVGQLRATPDKKFHHMPSFGPVSYTEVQALLAAIEDERIAAEQSNAGGKATCIRDSKEQMTASRSSDAVGAKGWFWSQRSGIVVNQLNQSNPWAQP
jgi:hypothetical protein